MQFTDLIKKIQQKLGMNPIGYFGKATVEAYNNWALANNVVDKIEFINAQNPKNVLEWIVKYWPKDHQCSKNCPVGYGEVLAMIYFESRDNGVSNETIYFNAAGGNAGSNLRNTNVGLGQISWESVSDAGITAQDRYNPEMNVKGLVNLIFNRSKPPKCSFSAGVGRFSTFADYQTEIFMKMGPSINQELGKVDSDPSRISEAALKRILGMP